MWIDALVFCVIKKSIFFNFFIIIITLNNVNNNITYTFKLSLWWCRGLQYKCFVLITFFFLIDLVLLNYKHSLLIH